jgi:hypothetical protein
MKTVFNANALNALMLCLCLFISSLSSAMSLWADAMGVLWLSILDFDAVNVLADDALWACYGQCYDTCYDDSNDDMLYGRVRFDQCFNVSSVFMGDAMTCPNVFIFLWAVTMTMLWHADMICYTMLCYAILWHAMVCYDVLCTKRSQNVRGLGG